MEYFRFPEKDVMTSQFVLRRLRDVRRAVAQPDYAALGLPKDVGAVSFETGSIPALTEPDLKDQFIVFQFSSKLEEQAILESSQVVPMLDGSEQEPDVLVHLELQSFSIGKSENIDAETRATMRINMGKDENSRDKYFDTVFWSIAAGLELYDRAKDKRAEGKEFKSDFRKAFANRPIEIPGGLSKLSFEVVKHKEPPWYKSIFRFLTSETGRSLISILGFPAVTTQAIHLVDELMNRIDDSEPEVLFKSLPMRLALTQQAKNDYTGGNERIRIGCLNPGFCILARGRDFSTFVNSDAIYYPSYGKLVPMSLSQADLMSGNYEDPFEEVTYAIFRVGMKKTKLDPTFNYG